MTWMRIALIFSAFATPVTPGSTGEIYQDLSHPKSLSAFGQRSASIGGNGDREELGVGDKLKISFFGNSDLTREAQIQSDGNISLTMLGQFAAAGKSVAELTSEITERFSQDPRKLASNVVVDVLEWRPVYVTGGVSKSGSYPYAPGMTVLHAISVAGGFYRIRDADPAAFINVMQNISRMREVQEQTKDHLVQRASLMAERAGEATVKMPAELLELVDRSTAAELLAKANLTLQLREKAVHGEIEMHQKQVALTHREIEDYDRQLKAIAEQLSAKMQNLKDLNGLLSKGISRRPDILNVESHVAKLESDRRELLASKARAEKELAKFEHEQADVTLQRQIKIEDELVAVNEKIRSNEALYEGARQVVDELGGVDPMLVSVGSKPKRSVMIMRNVNGRQIFVSAAYETVVKAGDVIVIGGQGHGGREVLASTSGGDGAVAPASSDETMVLGPRTLVGDRRH